MVDGDKSFSLTLSLVALFSVVALFGGFIFVFLPLVSGVMCFAKRTADGEKPRFVSVFEPFTSKQAKMYLSSVLLPLALLLRAAIIFLPVVGGIVNLWLIYTDVSDMTLFMIIADSAFILCLTALAFAVGVYISSYFFFVPYLVISGKTSFFGAFVKSVKMAHTRKAEITKQTLSQMPNVFVSVLSFMVLWVFFAAPRMLVSYFVYCNEVANHQDSE